VASDTALRSPTLRSPTLRSRALRSRTLRGRVSLLGTVVIASWLVLLVIGFDLVLTGRLRAQADDTVRARAEAVATTIVRGADGTVTVSESDNDTLLDSGVWVFAGNRLIEQPSVPTSVNVTQARAAAVPGASRTINGLRLYAMRVSSASGAPIATVLASVRWSPYARAITTVRVGAVFFALLVLAAAWVVLRRTVGGALRPMQAMSAQAARWATRTGSERFGPQRDKELDELAHSLDALLDRLAAALRHERQLVAELSHELRTPLSRIVTSCDLLLRNDPANEDIAQIHTSAVSMATTLETLLSTARLEQGMPPGTCDVAALLADIGPVNADVRIAPDARTIGVDAAVAERILAPVLDNAGRFATRPIDFDIAKIGDAVAIDVHTDGPAIPAELRERVFEPGFRLDPVGARHHDGVGLGLPLARRLARAADGDVTVEPSASGTTVRILVPSA
jgi:signal transduction histidine kinase